MNQYVTGAVIKELREKNNMTQLQLSDKLGVSDKTNSKGSYFMSKINKETGEFIGDCGITIQNIDGEQLPEIGYHINKKYWRKGYAKEAARACRDWAFNNTDYDTLYSYMKYTNVGSYSTALANGMEKIKEYPDPHNEISYAYAITRDEWKKVVG